MSHLLMCMSDIRRSLNIIYNTLRISKAVRPLSLANMFLFHNRFIITNSWDLHVKLSSVKKIQFSIFTFVRIVSTISDRVVDFV